MVHTLTTLTTIIPIIELTARQGAILAILRQSTREMSATDIGRKAGLDARESSARVGPILAQFVKQGMVAKREVNSRVILYTAVMAGRYKEIGIKIVAKGRKASDGATKNRKIAKLLTDLQDVSAVPPDGETQAAEIVDKCRT